MKTIPAGEFKARCLAVMDQVERTREPIIVTKRGKPVVRLVPAEPGKKDDIFDFWKGKLTVKGDILGPIVDEADWNCLK